MLQLPPLSLYVHIPWCVRKCPYCDFNSHRLVDGVDEMAYVAALLADLDDELALAQGRPLHSLFIGGGTPSLFSAEAIARLLDGIKARIPCPADMEITLEANPGTLEAGRFAGYREAGVNRFSIGVQSFETQKLAAIGRIHGRTEALAAVPLARAAGCENLNLDLMFGLPQQDLEQAVTDLETAVGLSPEHISYYQLTLEPNTLFHRRPPALPDDDRIWEMQQQGEAVLARSGYVQYEVSAYARPGRECRHNLNYWTFGDYLGIGAGAHGKITHLDRQCVQRRWKQRDPSAYLKAAGAKDWLAGQQTLEAADLALEFLMNALRLNRGFTPALFEQRTGLSFQYLQPGLELALGRELVEVSREVVCPSALGRRFLNDLLSLFLPAESAQYV